MQRQERLQSTSGIYHVMLRGINKQDIFEDDEDWGMSPQISIGSFEKESFSYEDKVPYLAGKAFMYIKANNVGNSLFRRK